MLKYFLAPVYNILAALSGSNDDVPQCFQLSSSIEDTLAEAEEKGVHFYARYVGEFCFFAGWKLESDLITPLVVIARILVSANTLQRDFQRTSNLFIKYQDAFSVLHANQMMTAGEFGATFHGGLVCCRLARQEAGPPGNWLELAHKALRMFEYWSGINPYNFSHCFHFLKAELHVTNNEDEQAISAYQCAIEFAQKNGFCRYEALAHDAASTLAGKTGRKEDAAKHLENAVRLYEEWGAEGLAKQIGKTH